MESWLYFDVSGFVTGNRVQQMHLSDISIVLSWHHDTTDYETSKLMFLFQDKLNKKSNLYHGTPYTDPNLYHLFDDRSLNIAIVGPENAGKTTIWNILRRSLCACTGQIASGSCIYIKNSVISIYDLGMDDMDVPIGVSNNHVIIFVLDSSNLKSYDICRTELKNVMSKATRAKLLIFANKCDKKLALKSNEVASRLDLKNLTQKWHVESCCALSGQGILRGFEYVVYGSSMKSGCELL
jgi:signal recognition particle receptor subunit beta